MNSSDNSKEEAEIRELIGNWAHAVRVQDMPEILANHASGILMFDVPLPFLSRGIQAYEKTWDHYFAESNYGGVFAIDSLEITAGDSVAFAVALMHCGTCDNNQPEGKLQFRLTVGLCKISGEWVVTHEHHSIPAI